MSMIAEDVSRAVRRHALGWLVAANLVGVWLAILLLWPDAGEWMAPLTYGRWVPLHLDWQLYGWCSLPLVGVLLFWCLDGRHPRAVAHTRIALGAWSLALALGGVSWLGGMVSGKLFLDWHGWARPLLPVAMSVLWAVLAAHVYWRWRRPDGARVWPQAVFLAAMAFVPSVLYWSVGREVFPEVNPGTGGATGASLLGSTLGVVAIFGLLPTMLGLKRTDDTKPWLAEGWFWSAYAATWGVFMAMDHGNASHHAVNQWAGLAALLVWVPLAWYYFRGFAWRAAARPWLAAAFVWWALLVATGLVTFLPGFSEHLKFTNGLVGHAHLAMAGLVTSLNLVIMESLGGAEVRQLTRGGDFWLWQGGCAVMVVALVTLGAFERDRAGELFRAEAWTEVFYVVRLGVGAAMAFASVRWLRRTFL